MKASKGSKFERSICKTLSLWWTNGERDDVFWRTSGSGARATVRSKRGKSTRNHYGDVLASDPIGQPLLDLCVVELKRGYNKETLFDLVDCKKGKPTWQKWIEKAEATAKAAGVPYWMIISQRDHKQALITFPMELGNRLCVVDTSLSVADVAIWECCLLRAFLEEIDPEHIQSLAKEHAA